MPLVSVPLCRHTGKACQLVVSGKQRDKGSLKSPEAFSLGNVYCSPGRSVRQEGVAVESNQPDMMDWFWQYHVGSYS